MDNSYQGGKKNLYIKNNPKRNSWLNRMTLTQSPNHVMPVAWK